jgi:hypothetical protein
MSWPISTTRRSESGPFADASPKAASPDFFEGSPNSAAVLVLSADLKPTRYTQRRVAENLISRRERDFRASSADARMRL